MAVFPIVAVALKRLWSNKGLTFCSVFGLTMAVALISCIPLYTDAANLTVLQQELEEAQSTRGRPPFSFMYRYIGAWNEPIELEAYRAVNEYLTRTAPGVIDLPLTLSTRYVKTDDFSMFPASEAAYAGLRQPLGWVNLAFIEGLSEHINILEGAFPAAATAGADVFDVLVSRALADETGMHVGEQYVIFMRGSQAAAGDALKQSQFTVRVSGIWEPQDEKEPFWFYSPSSLETGLMVPAETFGLRIAPSMTEEVYAALWYLVFDGTAVRTDGIPALLGRIAQASTKAANLLTNTSLDVSPVEALQNYQRTTYIMTIMLYVFSIPILALVLYFVGLISGLVVARQRGEIAVLKSRGTGANQVVGIYALEGILIGLLALALGLPLGRQLAIFMGNTVSFMTLGVREALPVTITPGALRLALAGVSVAVLASLVPALNAARMSVVTYHQSRARPTGSPAWQRFGLDFLLLVISGYGYYVLRNRGTLNYLGSGTGDPFQDPLLFLAPSFAIIAVSMLLIRLFPVLMEILALLTGLWGRSVSVVLGFRQLARVSRQYTGALLLLILTVSLATFTASMARTLDQSLVDRMYYQYGADYMVTEIGQPPEEEGAESEVPTPAGSESEGWVFVPVSEHLKADGVEAATRVGVYQARSSVGDERGQGVLYGIDRMEFPGVAYYRRDFASSSEGELMNRLAVDNSALLVSSNYLKEAGVKVGDRIELSVSLWGDARPISFVVADAVRYFPTYYPDDADNEYLFVANLDYLFQEMGGLYPYDVWVRTSRPLDIGATSSVWHSNDINVLRIDGSREAIDLEQARPERAGVFGILSVGFVAAAALTMLGFIIHSFISFRQRYIEFGVLRAIGLSVGQMIGFLGVEQLVLILTGMTAGTAVGVWVSRLFMPFFQVGTAKTSNIPPFVVVIAWDDITTIYIVFGVMLIGAVAGMIWFLLRLKIFEAVKLGEAV
jgi:putative ABC transport system permease protein